MTNPSAPPPRERGLLSRAIGILTSPTDVYRSIVASPRPAGILFLCCLVIGLATGLPLLTDQGRAAMIEMQLGEASRWSSEPPPPEARQAMEQMAPYMAPVTVVTTFIFAPVGVIVFSGLLWLLFNVIMGGTADFKQVMGVVSHGQVIPALGAALAAPIQYAQGVTSTAGPFHLGALAAGLAPQHPVARLLGMLTFFGLWQTVVTAIGLAVLYRRSSVGVAVTLLTLYVGVTALFFVFLPALFGR